MSLVQAIDRRERLRRLALETIDLSKDPYFMRNHLGQYECRLCLTLHNNEGNYLAHTQARRLPSHCSCCMAALFKSPGQVRLHAWHSSVLHASHAVHKRCTCWACMQALTVCRG
jgi:hypothetical protein